MQYHVIWVDMANNGSCLLHVQCCILFVKAQILKILKLYVIFYAQMSMKFEHENTSVFSILRSCLVQIHRYIVSGEKDIGSRQKYMSIRIVQRPSSVNVVSMLAMHKIHLLSSVGIPVKTK